MKDVLVHKKVHLVVCLFNEHGFCIEKAFRDKRKAIEYTRKIKRENEFKRTMMIEVELIE